MKFTASILSLLSTAAAFAPSSVKHSTCTQLQESKADLVSLAQKLNPVVGYYDPLNLAEADFWGQGNEATIGFLRHAELKHGRVAMAAFVGYITHAAGIKFPWAMQLDGSPFPDNTNPPALWDAISDSAKWQIFFAIFFLEFWGELSTPNNTHYMRGGKPGAYPEFTSGPDGLPHPAPFSLYDPFKLAAKMPEEKRQKRLIVEINNGRLAMIGIMGFVAEATTSGSVPLLKGIVQHYDGQVMAPFNTNIVGEPFGL